MGYLKMREIGIPGVSIWWCMSIIIFIVIVTH